MKSKTAALVIVTVAVLSTPLALADSGSDWLNKQMQTLQQQVGMRNAVAAAVERFQLINGYRVPEQLVARADDDAFKHELALLNKAIGLQDPTPLAMADAESGSNWLDKQIETLQRHVALRNAVADEAARFMAANGYTKPDQLVARSDDDAFAHELALLSQVIRLNDLSNF